MRSLAIIPARGGSKRVPGKNLAAVGGLTLVRRAVKSARPCDVVVVSTDDAGVRRVASTVPAWSDESPVSIHARKPEHVNAAAGLEDVIADVLAMIDNVGAETHGIGIDAIVLLQPTSPFRTAAHVAEALRILRETGCDSVVSVTPLHSLHSVFNGRTRGYAKAPRDTYEGEGVDRAVADPLYIPKAQNVARPRSQDLADLVYENGAVYAFTRKHWNATRNRMGGDQRALVMHWSEAVEIDTQADLDAARRLAR